MASGQQIASLYAEIGANTSQFESALKRSNGLINGVGNTLGTMVKVGIGAAVAGFAAMAAGLGSALAASSKFDKTMSGAKAILGATGDEMTKLNALAMQLGKDTVFSASEAGKAIEMLGQDGLNVQEIMGGAAKATVDLAAATGTDLSNAANIGSKAMKAFGIPADKMQQAINGIAGAANTNGLTIDGYAQAIAMAGGVAGSVGVSFDDFNASIAAIIPSFSSGSDAGTGFKTFLTRLVPQSDEAADAMKKIGLFTGMTGDEMEKTKGQIAKYEAQLAGLDPSSKNYERRADELKTKINSLNGSLKTGQNAFFNADGSMKNMADVAGVLQKSLAGLSDEAKVDALNTIFGTDASRVASALAKAGAAGFQSVFDKIAKTDAAQQAATRMDNLAGDVEQLSGSFDTLKIAIGHAFDPLARKVVQYITGGLNKLLGMDFKPFAARFDFAWEKIQKVIERVIGVFNRFASKTSGGLPSILGELGAVFGEWAGDIWAWIEPGLSAAITNLANWIKNPSSSSSLGSALDTAWNFFTEWAGAIWGWVSPKLVELGGALASWITDPEKRAKIGAALVSAWDFFTEWAGIIWGVVSPYLAQFWNYITSWVTDPTKRATLVGALATGWDWFTGWASSVWTFIEPGLSAAWSYITSWVTDEQKRGQMVQAIVDGWNWIADWASYIWTATEPYLTQFWNWLTSWVTDEQKRGQLIGALSASWDWFTGWADYIWEGSSGKGGVKSALGTMWNYLSSWVTDPSKRTQLYNNLVTTWTSFTDWASKIWNGADGKSGVSSQLVTLWGNVNAWLNANVPVIKPWKDALVDFIKGAQSQWTTSFPAMGKDFSDFSSTLQKELPIIGKSLNDLFGSGGDSQSNGVKFVKDLQDIVHQVLEAAGQITTALRIVSEAAALFKKGISAIGSGDWNAFGEISTQFNQKVSELPASLGFSLTGGGLFGAISQTGTMNDNMLNAIGQPATGHRASGGMVRGGNPYIVGERGPELFSPSSNGYIHNADNTSALLGGKTMTINLNVTGESNLPMDRAKLRELTKMLANEMNLSGARLIMQN